MARAIRQEVKRFRSDRLFFRKVTKLKNIFEICVLVVLPFALVGTTVQHTL